MTNFGQMKFKKKKKIKVLELTASLATCGALFRCLTRTPTCPPRRAAHALGNGHTVQKFVQLFVVVDGKLQVARDDP